MGRLIRSIALLAVLLFHIPAMASEWEWSITPYLWAADQSVDVSINDDPVLESDVSFSDVLDKLDMALQLHFEGRRGRMGFFADFTYLKTSDSLTTEPRPPLPGGTEIDSEAKTLLFEAGGSFRPAGEQNPFELIAGLRVISLDIDVDVTLPGPIGQTAFWGTKEDLVDVFAGARFTAPLGEHFFLTLRGDVGTGDTDFSWNVQGGLGWQFGGRDQFAAMLGYRHLDMEIEEDNGNVKVESDIAMSGPMAGFRWSF